ncbi:MAG: type 1 glutamine amidotransferase domain-containing protein [Spirochaetes bacterium]|nr:type 1 glutamine amidotransferase domain-containing protein [Spirochaetota bacterium]MBU0954033.1 type 1 glutamine amidotransferase domain-containing protein [Spirochaetota bacterium]
MKLRNKLFIIGGAVAAVIVVVIALVPTVFHRLGIHPEYDGPTYKVEGGKALIITTSHSVLAPPGETEGKPTGVFGSEMTHPYYVFLEAGMDVDLASIQGGEIPIDPTSFNFAVISDEDKRFKKDAIFQAKAKNSMKIDDVDFAQYDVVFLAGGWGAAYDLAQSEVLARKISEAYYSENQTLIGSVCHGALGLVNARDKDGKLLIEGRTMTGVTNSQLEALNIEFTPKHPEPELKKAGAIFESGTAFRDFFATHVSIDSERRFVTGQNQNSGLEAAHVITGILAGRRE